MDNRAIGMKILITGLSGLIGNLLGRELSTRHSIRGLCRSRVAGYEQVNASITEYDEILPAFRDVDVVVHLAAYRADDPVAELLRTNIDGTYNVFRAAAGSGVRRVVYASSAGVVRGYLKGRAGNVLSESGERVTLDAETTPWPVRPYDATKVTGESIARVFNENFGLETVCVRIGKCVADDVPVEGLIRPLWVSQRDITQLLTRCIEHPGPVGYEVLYGTSANRPAAVDIKHARNRVGYEPQDGCEGEASAPYQKVGGR